MEEASQAIVGGLAASAVGLVAVGLGALALTSGYQSSAKDSAERSVESAYQISVVANELPAIGESRTVLISHQGGQAHLRRGLLRRRLRLRLLRPRRSGRHHRVVMQPLAYIPRCEGRSPDA